MLPVFLQNLNPEIYLGDNYVVLDFEIDTSHGDYGNPIHPANQPLLVSYRLGPAHPFRVAWGDIGTVSDWITEETGAASLLAYIKDAEFIVAHNAKYELGWLKRLGADLRSILVFDTKIGEYVRLGNLAVTSKELGIYARSTSLDMCCRRRDLPVKDPVVDLLIKDGINPVRIPRQWLQGRCEQDVETTEQVFLDQRSSLHRMDLLPVLFTRCLLTPVLADIEPEGMALDADRVEEEYKKHVEQLGVLEDELKALIGGANWRSPAQMAKVIYDDLKFAELTDWRGKPKRSPEGKRKTDRKTLDKLTAVTSDQRKFLELRKEIGRIGAALSKNLEFFLGVIREYGGTFFAEFNQTNTATHRLSSSGISLVFQTLLDEKGKPKHGKVQFQNMPRAFKRLFKAKRPGWLMVEPDGSQIEFRVAAELGHDAQAIADIQDPNFDAHLFTASVLFDVPVADVTTKGPHSQRQLAKPDTFKPLYGGTKGSERQERYYAAFRQKYKGIDETQRAWLSEVERTGALITPWGLRYYWPNVKRSASGYVNVSSSVYNYPIQALATAEIIPIAMVYLWHGLRELGLEELVYIVNTVHDSIPCEVHPDAVKPFIGLVKRAFTTDVYHYLNVVYKMAFEVPLGTGIKVGDHWGEGTEVAFDIYPNGKEVKRK